MNTQGLTVRQTAGVTLAATAALSGLAASANAQSLGMYYNLQIWRRRQTR